jgi:hypothetical protein
MLLNLGIAIPQPPKIVIVERLKMHCQPGTILLIIALVDYGLCGVIR